MWLECDNYPHREVEIQKVVCVCVSMHMWAWPNKDKKNADICKEDESQETGFDVCRICET
jgi:hypothetical protein